MAETPKTFSESWYRVANQKICLRPVVKARRQNFRGERWIVLENPFSNQYFRLRPAAYEFVSRLRPDHTVEEVWQQCLKRFPDEAPSQEAVIQLLSQLYFANLLQYDLAADSAQLFERYKKRKQREIGFRFLNIMFMRFPVLDPDRFLVRTLPAVGKLISPFGALLWLVVVGGGLNIVVDNFSALRAQGQGILAANNLFLLYLGLILVKACHEFGHAYFCRRFGGEVHVMGVMLMIFTPMPYVDATSAWSFRERWKRVLVGAAGMIVEVFIAAIAAVFWAHTGPGVLHSLAYNIMFVASVSTVIFNVNPLMRFDGYYILSDLLEIPNLNQRAMRQLRHLAESNLFGVKNSESPAGTRREAAWLGFFGITSGLYRLVVFTGILLAVADRFLIIGIVMAAVCLISWAVVPLVRFVKYLAASPRLDRARPRAIGVTAGAAALLIVLLAMVPFPYSFRAPGIVFASQRTQVVNETAGAVVKLLASSGSFVQQGQPLLQLESPELDLQMADAQAHLEEVNARLLYAMDQETADLEPLTRLRDSVAAELNKLTMDSENLTVRAAHNGVWVAPGVEQFPGRWLPRGADLGLLANPTAFEFEATVTEDDAKSLFGETIHGASARLWGQAGTKLVVTNLLVVPGGQNVLPSPALGWAAGGQLPVAMDNDTNGLETVEPFFEVRGRLDPRQGVTLMDGRSGEIRFQLPARTALAALDSQLMAAFSKTLPDLTTSAIPTQDYRRSGYRVPSRPLTGLDALVNSAIGKRQRRAKVLESLKFDAEKVVAQEGQWTGLSDSILQKKLLEFRAQFRRGGRASGPLISPALAAIREAADRRLGLRPFPVQIIGALALHRGCLAEMATGEGKTLTAGLAAILAGWTKHPCHVVTVNDYLVQRDAEWLEPLYHFCGVRVGCVTATSAPVDRMKNYGCDVTYVTSKELLADFLRDRLYLGRLQNPTRRLIRRMLLPDAPVQDGMVLRGLHTAIVDEADSVLIDEAVTPLIIAASHENASLREASQLAQKMIGELKPGTDYQANPRYKEIEMTRGGLQKLVEQASHLPGMWQGHDRRLELVVQALMAREFYHRNRQYIVEGDKVVIVDEFTGRPMPQRTWREGMHQAIEAKENLPISDPSETIARLSFQRFFRCFYKLSGMTGTAREAAGELWQIYGLATIAIPPNKPCIRQQWPDRFFINEQDKWQAIIVEIEKIHASGRPILVGTRSVMASERLGNWLVERGLEAKILNATRLSEEAELIAIAGGLGRITIATNMAGRGTDIKLGQGVTVGGLHVIVSERHESGRVDRQLFGRSGRQGDPGSAQVFVSIQDELIRRYLSPLPRRMLAEAWQRQLPGRDWWTQASFKLAQSKAQSLALKQRQNVLRSDLWLEQALSFAGADTI